jgi:hypothetical protein
LDGLYIPLLFGQTFERAVSHPAERGAKRSAVDAETLEREGKKGRGPFPFGKQPSSNLYGMAYY